MTELLDPFSLPFVQRGVVEVLALSVGAGLLGTWIVMRGLAFYAHAVGTAAFPGLVLANGLGFSAALGAFGAAAVFALGLGRLSDPRRSAYDSDTALALVGALVVGIVLASDVFHSGGEIDTLLFGSLLLIDWGDVALAAAASALALAGTVVLGAAWTAIGFDPDAARLLGLRSRVPDVVLFALVALGVTAALSAVGALLVTALFVVPAASTRLWTARLRTWQLFTVALVAVEGVAGLWLSVQLNAPPGATIAVLAGAGFGLSATARALLLGPRRAAAAALAAGAAIALPAAGCGGSGTESGKVSVVASTTQIADWARAVGGSDVDVHQILAPNIDPHEYEPRPDDVVATATAKLVFVNGDNLDRWMGKVVSKSGSDAKVVDLGARVPERAPGETSGPEASRYDPHWWHDPRNAAAAVGEIRGALSAADPAHRAAYSRNAAAYLARLRRVDAAIGACLSAVPSGQRKLVTDHDAFAYFARRYGIAVIGAVIPSQSTAGQPSVGDVAKLSALIRRQGVKAVFPESSINPKLAQQIARQTGARSNFTLYGDSLGPEGSAGATYLRMEAANADALARGFTGGARGCPAATTAARA